MILFLPAWCKCNHPSVKRGNKWIDTPLQHTLVGYGLKLFERSAFITELAISKTDAAIQLVFTHSWILRERH